MKSIIFGEVIWDIYPHQKSIGGAPFNFAAHLSLLGDEAYLVTAVGSDDLGKEALCKMESFGIDTSLVVKNSYPTGQCTVTLDKNRIPSYLVHTDTAYDNIVVSDEMLCEIKELNADVFCFGTLIQRNPTSLRALKKILEGCSFDEIFCDINIREGCYNRESIELCMKNATTVKISDEELHYLYDTNILAPDCRSLADICGAYPNIKTLVYTKGAKGSEVYSICEGRLYVSPTPPKVEVVSTVGAGDCFGATYISSIYKGMGIPAALELATERSARVVASIEAVI